MQNESDSDLTSAVNYSNLVFANVVDWYKNADSKAQIILTLDGALVAFLTTSIFKVPSEVSLITQRFTTRTWLLLMAMCLCLVGSIISALMIDPTRHKHMAIKRTQVRVGKRWAINETSDGR